MTRLLAITLLLLSSCVNYVGPDGTRLTMTMTNAQSVSAGGLRMEVVNQTDGVKVAGEAASGIIKFLGWMGLAKAGVDAAEGVTSEVIEAATN